MKKNLRIRINGALEFHSILSLFVHSSFHTHTHFIFFNLLIFLFVKKIVLFAMCFNTEGFLNYAS